MKPISILICGIGGQGIISFSKKITELLLDNKLLDKIVQTESRGVSQREGMVTSLIRFTLKDSEYPNEKFILSPKLQPGIADIFFGLEPLESLRNIPYLSPEGLAIINTHANYPKNTLIDQNIHYPDTSTYFGGKLQKIYPDVTWVVRDFNELSQQKYQNSKNSTLLMLSELRQNFTNIFE